MDVIVEKEVASCSRDSRGVLGLYSVTDVASFPGALGNWGEERLVSTVRACAAPQVFVGNLETTVILVCVARPYITGTRESFTSTRRSSVRSTKPCRTPSVRSESQEWC